MAATYTDLTFPRPDGIANRDEDPEWRQMLEAAFFEWMYGDLAVC